MPFNMTKTINNIPVSDEVFAKMSLLQERLRRIDAEARILMMEKSETEREVNDMMAKINADAPKSAENAPAENTLAQQVAAVTTPAVS